MVTPDEHPLLTKLKQTLTQTKKSEPLDIGSIRLKLKMPNETFFADGNGRVRRVETGELFHLSEQQMKDIGRDIEYLAGVVDTLSVEYTESRRKQ